MKPEQLDEIESVAKAAPQGKWEVRTSNSWRRVYATDGSSARSVILPAVQHDGHPDLAFAPGVKEWLEGVTPSTVLSLIAEVKRLSAIVEKYIDPSQVMMTGMNIQNGSFDIGLEGGACRLFVESFAEYFKNSEATNFLEMRFASTDPDIGELVLTLQRIQGKTPGQLKHEAEAERDALMEALADCREAVFAEHIESQYFDGAVGDPLEVPLFVKDVAGQLKDEIKALRSERHALTTAAGEMNAEVVRLREREEKYQQVCAAAYQMAGTVNAPVRFLDALSDASCGEFETRGKIEDLLPVAPDETGSFLSDQGEEYREDAERWRWLCEKNADVDSPWCVENGYTWVEHLQLEVDDARNEDNPNAND